MTMTTNNGFKWQPIADLPENWQDLSVPELSSLALVWVEQRDRLKESQAVKEFNERLLREWSIETGVIERLYTIDRGITQVLIEQGIDAALIPHEATDRPVGEVVSILQDHREALEGLFAFVAKRVPLTTSYIKQLHQVLTRHQTYVEGIDQFGNPVKMELSWGTWKQWPNNPTRPNGAIHEYCPPLQVAGEMERLVELYHAHPGVTPEVQAAWLHHRFTQIHPFQDGNGRVARALSTLVFLQTGWFPLVINRDQRGEYIAALEAADYGDLQPLASLFGQNAKQALRRALALSEDVLRGEKELSRVVERLASVYAERRRAAEETYQRVDFIAEQLMREAVNLLGGVADQIRERFGIVVASPPIVRVTRSHEHNEYYYAAQIVSVAQKLDYFANLVRRRSWVRLHLADGQKTHIVFSFHHWGKANQGIKVCTAFTYFPETKPEIQPEAEMEPEPIGETHHICDEPFYFSYKDELRLEGLKADFHKWMERAISVGLAEWAQRL